MLRAVSVAQLTNNDSYSGDLKIKLRTVADECRLSGFLTKKVLNTITVDQTKTNEEELEANKILSSVRWHHY